ncbi:uncharacterized protein NEMAJ01_0328 [Nematocida major]|uniref:uncharacterized protein n=1 Tax=Nematocida major TaxID=1912982 RepID=UPI00200825EB|nr:uncharacterized protein NEMAJ01_0328 [Nematocida major]KAH9385432.1 hypothetical protein NEMAJ01_0328 [Nematocida major]
MNKSAPEDLLKIYTAHVEAHFTGCALAHKQKKYSAEQAAHITYFKVQEELLSSPGPFLARPLIYTRVIGPLHAKEKERLLDEIKKALPEIDDVQEHSYALMHYLVIRAAPWAVSVLDTLPGNLLVEDRRVHRLCLDRPPAHFPAEMVMSTCVTTTLCLLNVDAAEQDILQALSEYRVEFAVCLKARVYLKLCRESDSRAMYSKLCGSLVDGKSIFIWYYPDCLSQVNLFL